MPSKEPANMSPLAAGPGAWIKKAARLYIILYVEQAPLEPDRRFLYYIVSASGPDKSTHSPFFWRMELKRLIIATLLTFVAFASMAQPAAAADPILVVVFRDEGAVSFINAKTHETIGELDVGKGPQEVVATPDGKTVFVSNFGDHRNYISVIDVAKIREVKKLKLLNDFRPHGMGITRNGKKLYATCEGSRSVVEIDLASGEVMKSLKTVQKGTHMLALSPDDNVLYASNTVIGNVSAFDLKTGELIRHIISGKGCDGIAVKPDGSEVWVANRRDDTIAIISTAEKRRVKILECRGYPTRVVFTPDGKRALVSCPSNNLVSVFDTATYDPIKHIRTPTAPVGLVVEPSGKRLYSTNTGDNSVSVIDLETYEETANIKVGRGPYGITYIEAR